MNILVSACLLGVNCRYSGKGELCQELQKLMKEHHLIPVCPEQLGGLATPRTPAERVKDRVVTQMGEDVTAQYEKGARETAEAAGFMTEPSADNWFQATGLRLPC